MPIPTIRPELTRYEVWRWRPDVEKWAMVSSQPTLEAARTRLASEVSSRTRRTGTRPVVRITESVTTRREVQ